MCYTWQISTDQPVIGYPTKAFPQRLDDGQWVFPYERFYWLTWHNASFYVSEDNVIQIGKQTFLAYNLLSDEPLTSEITIATPQSLLMDLGNYRIVTCHHVEYVAQRWKNLTYSNNVTLEAGCHIHSNVMMVEHHNLSTSRHKYSSKDRNLYEEDYSKRKMTQVSYISNHTFGLNVFVQMPPEGRLYEQMLKATDALKTYYETHGKIIDNVHNQTRELIQKFEGETHKIKMLVDSGYLQPRDFKYAYDCSFVGFFRKLIHADFACIMRWNPFHWFKELLFYLCIIVLLFIGIKICFRLHSSSTKQIVIQETKRHAYKGYEAT